MKNREWLIIVMLGIFAITVVLFNVTSSMPFNRDFFARDFPLEPPAWTNILPYLLIIKAILTSLNAILLLILLVTYVEVYRKTESKFSIGLIIFTLALLLYAISDNPLLHGLAGFRASGLGPFTILPDIFTLVASAVLLYLSQQ
ncbi:MAG: hypothetical protein QG670_2112 [Thermoproteota archaeon]|nr:hypothetical protein [Thermoproteota archaeon]